MTDITTIDIMSGTPIAAQIDVEAPIGPSSAHRALATRRFAGIVPALAGGGLS